MDYQIKHLEQQDLPQILSLIRIAFKIEPDEGTFIWKYFYNPFGNAVLGGIFYDDELVAYGAAIPERMYCQGKEKNSFKYTDFMVHPNHRRKGLTRKIIQALFAEANDTDTDTLGYTMCSKIATKGFAKMGFLKLASIDNHFKPSLLIRGAKLLTLNRAKYFDKITKYDVFPEEFIDFSFKPTENKITLVKSIPYLKWRMSNPKFKNEILLYKEGLEVLGYLMLSDSPNRLLHIIDFEVKEDNKKIINALISYAEDEVLKKGYKGIVGLTISTNTWVKTLNKKGFVVNRYDKGPLQSILDFNVLKREEDFSLDAKNWEISSLNYDDI